MVYSLNNDQTVDLSIRFMHIKPLLHHPDLIAHWALDEGSGFECLDWSGNDLTAYMNGHEWNTFDSGLTSSFRKYGKRGGCIYLNGKQWLQVESSPHLQHGKNFTISIWIKPDDIRQALIFKNGSEKQGYSLSINDDASFTFSYFTDNETLFVQSKDRLINIQDWQKLGVSFNGNTGRMILFYNDKPVAEMGRDTTWTTPDVHDVYIGGDKDSPEGFKGKIDEISLFSKAFDNEEIQSLYITGLPKIYMQSRETIDKDLSIWNTYHGNSPIPHPIDSSSLMTFRFDGRTESEQGHTPTNVASATFVPGIFGGALDASKLSKGLHYSLMDDSKNGTIEAWIMLSESVESPLLMLKGEQAKLELILSDKYIRVIEINQDNYSDLLMRENLSIPFNSLFHVALCWSENDKEQQIELFLNGVKVASKITSGLFSINELWIGGNDADPFNGLVDDVNYSSISKVWGEICPRGSVYTESPAIDFMENFNQFHDGPLMHWMSNNNDNWSYSLKHWDRQEEAPCIIQTEPSGKQVLYHPDAYGHHSSFEASIGIDSVQPGWTGVFVQSGEPNDMSFTGHTFSINWQTNQLRLATFENGKIIQEKLLHHDFKFSTEQLYQLSLSSVNRQLRGFIDNRNVISMTDRSEVPQKGFSGFFTMDAAAYFDDAHFKAITPSSTSSRKIQVRKLFENDMISFSEFSFNAFRWKKRHGLVPWERNYKNPEPPGNIFGPDNQTIRPNPSSEWRSQDAANSAVILANGTFYYFMRGNPTIDGRHGNARIGVLWVDENDFDGIHFHDPTWDQKKDVSKWVLTGHQDTNIEGCSDSPPRDAYFQLNDQGVVFIDGKIIMVCREFRNRNQHSNRFQRLVMGLFDTESKSWLHEKPVLMDWSSMNPDSCYATFKGINATPEIILVRDPESDDFVVLLYHSMTNDFRSNAELTPGRRYNAVSGFSFDGQTLKPHPDYPEREGVSKTRDNHIFGERIMFDNGIWYKHINAHRNKLDRDWPDRFELYTSLDPYLGPWHESRDNQRPYFERGSEFDPDNGAVWQGAMLKYRNRYYMFYENYHVIDNIEEMYEMYNHLQTGSRVGYSVAN